VPLQPLQDNLEAATYETFERDAIKYTSYEAAVHAALLDRVPEAQAAARVTVVMVVGAGRGPLVKATLDAAARAARRVRVYAVEKNPNAVITLQHRIADEGWGGCVTLVSADMRHWRAPEAADILVSELLGSFGDNELSPECLDGAQRFLAPGGVSIPASYTSYAAPVTTAKLHNELRAGEGGGEDKPFETPYVVQFHRHHLLAPPQPVFTFEHPHPDAGHDDGRAPDNSRASALRFERPAADLGAVCHGLAGYFETTLYGDVRLSTLPDSHTPGMYSWFPIYFPLRSPLRLAPGAPLHVRMWRCASGHKVWYEWCAAAGGAAGGGPSHVHNVGGRSYHVGL
jgi:protein arginine N-methyltransferase 5